MLLCNTVFVMGETLFVFISLPTTVGGKLSAAFMILCFGYLYIKAMEHLFRNGSINQTAKILWSLFMAVIPMIAPSIYLATHLIKPAE